MKFLGAVALAWLLTGCAAAQLSLEKQAVDVQTRISTAIFVEPPSADRRTLYIELRSGVEAFPRAAFNQYVTESLSEGGQEYQLTDNPEEADYYLLVSVFNLEKASITAAEKLVKEGYGGSVSASMFSLLEYADLSDSDGAEDFLKLLGAAIIMGAIEGAVNASVSDVRYVLVADVEVREMAADDVVVRKDTEVHLMQGDTGATDLITSEVVTHTSYRTRIVTSANKANLTLEEAKDTMFQQMAYAIAGIFAGSAPIDGPVKPEAAEPPLQQQKLTDQ